MLAVGSSGGLDGIASSSGHGFRQTSLNIGKSRTRFVAEFMATRRDLLYQGFTIAMIYSFNQ